MPRHAIFSLSLTLAVFASAATPALSGEPPQTPPVEPPTAAPPPPPTAPPPDAAEPGMREVFPSVRVDRAVRVIELDAQVPIDVNNADTPVTYLEVMVCVPNTKEHETLAMTRAKAAHVHAALLMIGLEAGSPGAWSWDAHAKRMTRTPPTGPGLTVEFVWNDADGVEHTALASDWVVNTRTGQRLTDSITPDPSAPGLWTFAGSVERTFGGRSVYKADADGTIVGLTTFGSETIAWRGVYSHEATLDEPEWVADKAAVPPFGTRLTVRIRPAL